ncbi:hypothetical protein DFJ43DRAFT_1063588 [Lentinula guzmanii]|uniref:F-box domain-containing protein n=1 Tax=Lentinula guzmanii TaxID=2804957 RepID=A0AA38N3J0_9AGAR|nr:hypothetical protein DFJ43DRAFT_1063588 [Lentinula guzmanii]
MDSNPQIQTTACPDCGYSYNNTPLRHPLPRIGSLLRTNDPLTEEEEVIFRDFLGDRQSILSQLGARILSIKALLRELEISQSELQMAITQRNRLLNPIRRMPPELLREIFLHGAGYYMDAEKHLPSATHSLDLKFPPWSFSRVCRSWKEIIIHTPLLWTRVKVDSNKIIKKYDSHARPKDPQLPLGLSLLSLYLSRSAALPLTVYLDIYSLKWDDYTYAISTLIASSSQRWESLFLGSGRGFDCEDKLFSSDSFPLLRMLWALENSNSKINIRAPNLRSWSTVGVTNTGLIQFSTALLQITDHSISNVSASVALIRVGGWLPDLQKLTVRDLIEDFTPSSQNPVKLLYIKELSVVQTSSAYSRKALERFFCGISCPKLVSLSVIAHDSLEHTIQGFEERSAFNLEHLDFTNSTNIFQRGLKNTVSMKSLVIRDIAKTVVPSVKSILSYLEPLDTVPVVPFPNLHRLELHLCSPILELDSLESLFLCVSSRLSSSSGNGSVSPHEVFITAPDSQAREMLDHPRLGELRLLGMKVDIVAL